MDATIGLMHDDVKIHHQASFTQIILNPLPPSYSFHVGIQYTRAINFDVMWMRANRKSAISVKLQPLKSK